MATLTSSNHPVHRNHQFAESTDGSVSMDSQFEGDSPAPAAADNADSCCSEDTVLSVGNENPVVVVETSTDATLSFKNIENHLNAISKITNTTLDPESGSRKSDSPPSPALSCYRLSPSPGSFPFRVADYEKSNSHSPVDYINSIFRPSLRSPSNPAGGGGTQKSQYTSGPSSPDDPSPKPPELQQFYLRHNIGKNITNNNEPNSGGLKFSIDNILKADFGRRITDPINIRKSKPSKKVIVAAAATAVDVEKSPDENGGKSGGPVDLSKPDDGKATEKVSTEQTTSSSNQPMLWPAWVYCTRYSDRPSSGPRTRRVKKAGTKTAATPEEKRPRTAFSGAQLARLKHEFAENRYLTERRRQQLSQELGLNEAQIKIWFQNKRAKIKKASGQKNPLALQLMAQGLYNHSTIPLTKEEEELQEMHAKKS